MSPQEPKPLCWLWELRVEIPHQGHKRTRAAICCNNGSSVRRAKRVFRIVLNGSSEETSVHVQKVYGPKWSEHLIVSKFEKTLTHLANSKHDMPLHYQSQGIPARVFHIRVAVAEACNLQDSRYIECSELAVQLQDGLIRGYFGAEGLVMYDAHAFGGEAVFPCVD